VASGDGSHKIKSTVMRFSGTSWETVGPAGFSLAAAGSCTLVLRSLAVPYVTFENSTFSKKPTVMRTRFNP
jgi:hypothetical protein